MARRAICIAVLAEQREPGQPMIKEHVLAPGLFVMAVLADNSLGTLVGIVFFMAQTAVGWGLNLKNRLDMTGRAIDTGMSTTVGVLRVYIVIERRLRPLSRYMAGVAALAKMPIMVVIVAVAGKAGCRQLIGKWVFAMAVVTCERRMLAGQTE